MIRTSAAAATTRAVLVTRRARRRLPGGLEPLRIQDAPIRRDQDCIDIGKAVVDAHGFVSAEHERGLRQTVGTGGGRSDDGRAAHLARRMSGARVDNMVITHAVLVEIALIVTRSRERAVSQRYARDHLVGVVGMANTDDPGLTEAIADHAAVTAGVDQRMREAARAQNVDAAVDRVALGDATEVYANPGLREAHRAGRGIQQYVPVVHRRQRALDLLLGGPLACAKVIHIAHAGVGNVESAFGNARILERRGQQLEELRD